MITYWPSKQSINLNAAVSNIFTQTYQKLLLDLCNKTNRCTPLDVFNKYIKRQILLELLIELEILVVDIIELNISIHELKQLNNQVLLYLINTTGKRLLDFLESHEANFSLSFRLQYNRLFFHEHSNGASIVLTYLIFGSENVSEDVFPFKNNKTPVYHVKALFENMLMQISNTVAFNLLENSRSITRIDSLIRHKGAIYYRHQSIRAMSNFKNSLISNNLINFYIYYPQNVYCGKYTVHLLSTKGIIRRYIYFNRSYEYIKLSNSQLVSVTYLEIKDFIAPRLNQFIALIGKLMIYVFAEIISRNFNMGLKYAARKISIQK